jgi:hypothetical protein
MNKPYPLSYLRAKVLRPLEDYLSLEDLKGMKIDAPFLNKVTHHYTNTWVDVIQNIRNKDRFIIMSGDYVGAIVRRDNLLFKEDVIKKLLE